MTEKSRVLILKPLLRLQHVFRCKIGGKPHPENVTAIYCGNGCGSTVFRAKEHPHRWYPTDDFGEMEEDES